MSDSTKRPAGPQAPKKVLIERRRQEEEAKEQERRRREAAGELPIKENSESEPEEDLSSPIQSPLSIGSFLKDEDNLQSVFSPPTPASVFSTFNYSPAAQKSPWQAQHQQTDQLSSGPSSHRSGDGDGADSGFEQSPSIRHQSSEGDDAAAVFNSPPPSNATTHTDDDDDLLVERQLTLTEQRLMLKELQQRRNMMRQMGQDVPGLAQPLPIASKAASKAATKVTSKAQRNGKKHSEHNTDGSNRRNSSSDLQSGRDEEEPKNKRRPHGKDISVFLEPYQHQQRQHQQHQHQQHQHQHLIQMQQQQHFQERLRQECQERLHMEEQVKQQQQQQQQREDEERHAVEERKRAQAAEEEREQRQRVEQERQDILRQQEEVRAMMLQEDKEEQWRRQQQHKWRMPRDEFSSTSANPPPLDMTDLDSGVGAPWSERLHQQHPHFHLRSFASSSSSTPSPGFSPALHTSQHRRSLGGEPYPPPPIPPPQTSLAGVPYHNSTSSASTPSTDPFHGVRRSLSHPGGTAVTANSAQDNNSRNKPQDSSMHVDYTGMGTVNADPLSEPSASLLHGKDVLMVEEIGDKAIDLGLDGLYLPKDIKVEPSEEITQDSQSAGGDRGSGTVQEDDISHTCQVCGDIAAGFHCGAYVCEACKKFFVRCVKADSGVKFMCPRNKACLVTKETRTQCQYCRYQKCLSIGMYKPGGTNISSEIAHIPCKVCGAPSSGYHFGAITCEGCKGFFRRTVKERDSLRYQCSRGSNCSITISTRNVCKFCRYQKCLNCGMKPDGSRIGRQPNSVKHATMIELHQIKMAKGLPVDFEIGPKVEPVLDGNYGGGEERMSVEQIAAQAAAAVMDTSTTTPDMDASRLSFPSSASASNSSSVPVHIPKSSLPSPPLPSPLPSLPPHHHHHHHHAPPPLPSHTPPPRALPQSVPPDLANYDPHYRHSLPSSDHALVSSSSSSSSVMPMPAPVNEAPPNPPPSSSPPPAPAPTPAPATGPKYRGLELDASMDQIINAISVAQQELRPILIRGTDLPVEFDNSVGRMTVWQFMMGQFANCAHAVLKFAKKVPGFRKTPIKDQITVVQNSMYPIVVTILSLEYNMTTGRFNYFNFSEDEKNCVWDNFPKFRNLESTFIQVGDVVKRLSMDKVEVGFLCGIRLLCDDASKPFQDMLKTALTYYCQERDGGEEGMIRAESILHCLITLEEANMVHQSAVTEMAMSTDYSDLPMPELFQETFLND